MGKIAIAATFTAGPLEEPLKNLIDLFEIDFSIEFCNYQNYYQTLLISDSLFYKNAGGINIFLIRIEDLISSEEEVFSDAQLYKIEELAKVIDKMASSCKTPFILVLCHPSIKNFDDPSYMHIWVKQKNILNKIVIKHNHVYLIEPSEVVSKYISDYYDIYTDEVGQIPYSIDYFDKLALVVMRKIYGIITKPYKVIVVDCDNTLWDGVCGEDSINQIKITKNRKYLQNLLINQSKQGKLICIGSKNDFADVESIFDNHNEMVLTMKHITAHRINWNKKSENIKELAGELNLSLDSFIVIDDSPAECAEIRSSIPECMVIQLPKLNSKFPDFFKNIWAFDSLEATEEDKHRTQWYQSDNERKTFQNSVSSFDDFLESLNLKVVIAPLKKSEVERASQLTYRINQFNIFPQPFTKEDLIDLQKTKTILTVCAEDRFGKYGLIGMIGFNHEATCLVVDMFMVSCRALGKNIEKIILNEISKIAKAEEKTKIKVIFKSSVRNEPVHLFLQSVINAEILQIDKDIVCYHMATDIVYSKSKSAPKSTIFNVNNKSDALLNNHAILLDIATNACKAAVSKNINYTHNLTQEVLLRLFRKHLNVKNIKLNDNFFEKSGDSLKAVLLAAEIVRNFKIKIEITDVFQNPTVESLYNVLTAKDKTINSVSKAKISHVQELLLSAQQKSIWLSHQLGDNKSSNNVCMAIELSGRLDIEKFKLAWQVVFNRHEIFKAMFKAEGDSLTQIIVDQLELAAALTIKIGDQQSYKEAFYRLANKIFNLAKPPCFAAELISLSDINHILMFCFHHIVIDGWSFSILCKELSETYNTLVENKLSVLEKDVKPYSDYVMWQKKSQSYVFEENYSFWSEKLKGFNLVSFSACYTDSTCDSSSARINFVISSDLTLAIKTAAKKMKTTVFNFTLSVYAFLLSKYCNQNDFVVGSLSHARNNIDFIDTVGLFTNVLIMRFFIDKFEIASEFICKNHLNTLDCLKHQDISLEELVKKLRNENGFRESNLTKVMFVFENYKIHPLELKNIKSKRLDADNQHQILINPSQNHFDFALYLQEISDELIGMIEYNPKTIRHDLVVQFKNDFLSFIKQIADNCDIPLNQLSYPNSVTGYNNIDKETYKSTNIVALFEEAVEKNYSKIAVLDNGMSSTYKELIVKVNQLANLLLENGVVKHSIVGVYLPRSALSVISLLSTLKLGAIFLPLDSENPIQRLKNIIDDAQPVLIITNEDSSQLLTEHISAKFLLINFDSLGANKYQINNKSSSNDAAYIVYTSGSTGKPKGVVVNQRTLINLYHWQIDQLPKTNLRIAQLAAFGFDVYLQEAIISLLAGHQLVIIPDYVKKSQQYLVKYIHDKNINILLLPTYYLNFFAEEAINSNISLNNLMQIIVAGQQLLITDAIKEFFNKNKATKLINHYGPSETHVVTSHEFNDEPASWEFNPPIGKPISNTNIFILDQYGSPVSVGVIGEIHVAGANLARGYLNNEELTNKKFIKENFLQNDLLLYKTGDLAYFRLDGAIQLIGRIDNQVKIRGYRIELEEIEQSLLTHPSIQEAVVLNNEAILHAYIVIKKQFSLNANQVNDHLHKFLPKYMIPTAYHFIEKISLTVNGKVDKNSLLRLSSELQKKTMPITKLQIAIAEVFSTVLNLPISEIGLYDDFFDLGGSSLLVIKLIYLINKKFNIQLESEKASYVNTIYKLCAMVLAAKESSEEQAVSL